MNPVYKALNRMIQCLSDCEVRFALIGGLAMIAHSEPRFTRDVDLIVEARSAADAERLKLMAERRPVSGHGLNKLFDELIEAADKSRS